VKTLSDAGVQVGVFVMPLLPRINDGAEDLDLLVRSAKEAGASYLAAQVLFLRKCSEKRFFPFLEERFPELVPYYRRLYAGYHTEALTAYTREKTEYVRSLKRKYGLCRDYGELEKGWPAVDQPTLLSGEAVRPGEVVANDH
jgi:DNA repair photolyase